MLALGSYRAPSVRITQRPKYVKMLERANRVHHWLVYFLVLCWRYITPVLWSFSILMLLFVSRAKQHLLLASIVGFGLSFSFVFIIPRFNLS